jgi:hypothetical protein
MSTGLIFFLMLTVPIIAGGKTGVAVPLHQDPA